MKQEFYERLVSDALDLAGCMMRCGAEVRNVENTIERICTAYGAVRCDVFALSLSVFATIWFPGNAPVNCSRRIAKAGTSLNQLEEYNDLSRYVCRERPEPEYIEKRMAEIKVNCGRKWWYILGYIIGAGAFTAFVGGDWRDCVIAAVIGAFIFFCDEYLKRNGMNKLIYTLLMCAVTGCLAIFSVRWGLGKNSDKIMIGDIMLFIPTLTLCNAVKDMLYGDIFTGVYYFIDAVLITFMIALGFYISEALVGV